ncbi:GumC family protein [Aestuariivirga sp.]|uniref:GumC family protein n=1 Tax=Aestuariivirga sp. TaxID=2650926 RepID=UPI0039E53793
MNSFREFGQYLAIARRRALYVIIPFVLIAGAGIAVIMSLPSIYQSQATILVESQKIPEDLVKSTVTSVASERIQVIEQRVTTRDNLLAIADKFHLFQDRPTMSKSDIADTMKQRIDIEQGDVKINHSSGNDKFAISFTVSYEDESPEQAAKVANELVTSVLNEDVRNRTSRASETSRFLEKEAERLNDELAANEAEVAKFKLANSDALPEKLQFNMQLLDKAEKDVSDSDRDIAGLSEDIRLMTFEAKVRDATTGGDVSLSGRALLQKQVDAMKSDIATKSATMADSHPEMRTLRGQLKALEVQLANYKDTNLDAANGDKDGDGTDQGDAPLSLEARVNMEKIKTLKDRMAFLQKERDARVKAAEDLRAIIVKTPEVGSGLGTLERKRDATQKTLDDINTKYSQAKLGERLEEDQQAERFEVIEQPVVPQIPSRPARAKLIVLALGTAMAAGAGLAFAAETLDTTIRTAADLESRFGLRPFVVIPYIRTEREGRSRRRKVLLIILAILLAIGAALAAIHFLYLPLDVVWYKILTRLGH